MFNLFHHGVTMVNSASNKFKSLNIIIISNQFIEEEIKFSNQYLFDDSMIILIIWKYSF